MWGEVRSSIWAVMAQAYQQLWGSGGPGPRP
jgi:hypothetical protein